MRIASGVTDQYIYFVAVDATDLKTRETGLSSFTVYRSRNGAAAAAMTSPTINETDSSNMPGVYELLCDEDMTIDSGDEEQEMCFHITHAGMAPVTRAITLFRPKITAGNTLGVAADGDISGNVDGAVASVTGNVGGNVAGSVASVTAGVSLANDAVDGDAVAATAVSEIQSGLATAAALQTVDNEIATLQGDVTTIAGDVANIDGEAMRGTDSAATASALSTLAGTIATLDALKDKLEGYFQLLMRSDAAIETDRATELGEINADEGSGAGDFSAQTDSVEAIRNTAPLGTAMRGTDGANTTTPLTASGVRTAIGLASANLDTQLATLLSQFQVGFFRKNTADQVYIFPLYLAGTHTLAPGVTPAIQRVLDNGSKVSGTGTVAEIGSSGYYRYTSSAADMNGDAGLLEFSEATVDTHPVFIKFVA